MSTPNHRDLAEQAFNESALPAPPRRGEDALGYVTRLLSILPVDEKAGYVKAPPGGENSLKLPDGTLVRTGRVMYPDGQIVKVMSDVPNGRAQWVLEDIRPTLYHPFTGMHSEPSEPAPPPDPSFELRIQMLEQRLAEVEESRATRERVEQINENLRAVDAASIKALPVYVGRAPLFGGTVRSNPEVKP